MGDIMKKYLAILVVILITGCNNGEPLPAFVKSNGYVSQDNVGELPIRLTTTVLDTKFSNMQFSTITSDNYSGEHIEFLE